MFSTIEFEGCLARNPVTVEQPGQRIVGHLVLQMIGKELKLVSEGLQAHIGGPHSPQPR